MLLRTIDSLWVEHLTELDDMRRGIGLRGYAQQDPLNEFRKEAYRLYEELRDLIRRQVATTIFRVTVKREPATVPLPGPGQPARPRPCRRQRPRDGPVARRPSATGRPAHAAARSERPRPAAAAARGPARRGPGRAAQPGARTRRDPRPPGGPDAERPPGARATARPGDAVRPGYTPSGARIGRNDPCWCGSGQKYKKCHGA